MERLLKKGYEVIYLTEPVDEYCIQALPEFDGKRFQNVAKEGVKFDESDKAKENREALEKEYEPLTTWLKDKALKDKVERWLFCSIYVMGNKQQPQRWCSLAAVILFTMMMLSFPQIEKAVLSQRLTNSPCALVASQYGWSGNMERIMKAQAYQTGKDISTKWVSSSCHSCKMQILRMPWPAWLFPELTWRLCSLLSFSYYASQKKTLEINPKHPLIKQMLKKVSVSHFAVFGIF